jgi:hypothetical protein
MNMNCLRTTVLKSVAALCLTVLALPALSLAQQGQGAGGRAGGGMGGQMPQLLQQVLGQLDLSADQKTKIDGLLKQAQQDRRDAMQGLQDATPEERQQKMQDMQKAMADTKTKVEAELTPEQKTKYYPLVASTGLKYFTGMVDAIKTAATKMDVGDDKQKQLKDVFDDAGKSLDGLKADADAVKDEAGATDFQQKMTKLQMETRKQIVDVLGQDDARQLMQGAARSMAGGVGAGGVGAGGGRGATLSGPATQPAAK